MIILFVVAFIASIVIVQSIVQEQYLRGQHGEKCYITGEQHGNINIQRAMYFDTLQECLDSL